MNKKSVIKLYLNVFLEIPFLVKKIWTKRKFSHVLPTFSYW